jgi:uncharacterized protein YjbI with pentapeptide repeats
LSENHEPTALAVDHPDLRADCSRCFGLCCVVPAFAASADFAIDKPARTPCPNLRTDFRCGIHTTLRQTGFTGCTVYDCLGAGQKVSQVTFGGQDWRTAPDTARQMFDVFPVMRALQELLRYLTEALTLTEAPSAAALHADLGRAREQTDRLTRYNPHALLELDVEQHRQEVNVLLLRASELARTVAPAPRPPAPRTAASRTAAPSGRGKARGGRRGSKDHRGADLIGANLRGADLTGASLRGAYLIGADLREADLRMADVIGADFRDADLRGADLTGALFLLQSQLDAAKGDTTTILPPGFTHPAHWR